MSTEENKKISYNAVSAYLLLMISWVFLFIKKNKLINNELVKNHTKSAIVLHLLLFFTYLIFIGFGFLNVIQIFGMGLNTIIAIIIFIFILGLIVFGIYKAINFQKFNLGEFIKVKNKSFLDITKDGNFGEKDKLTLLISYIPFLGYIIGSKYDENKEVRRIIKFNLLISVIILIIYLLGYRDLTSLSILFYIIFVSFVGVNLFSRSELINFNLPDFFIPSEKLKYLKSIIKYLKYYISGKFKNFKEVKQEIYKKEEIKLEKDSAEVQNLELFKGPKWLIYTPIINFITLFQKENKYKFHIRNGIIISLLTIVSILLIVFKCFNYKIFFILLFPICFGFGKLYKTNYKMPYIYEIYEFLSFLKRLFIRGKKKINEKRKEVKEVNLKVEK